MSVKTLGKVKRVKGKRVASGEREERTEKEGQGTREKERRGEKDQQRWYIREETE